MLEIPKPNRQIIKEYLIKWDNLEDHYKWEESSLNKLFHKDYKNHLNKMPSVFYQARHFLKQLLGLYRFDCPFPAPVCHIKKLAVLF